MKKKFQISLFIILSIIIGFNFPLKIEAASNPILLFSDLDSGPKVGWNGSLTKGVAVSIWGRNFGAERGSSYVTVGGVNLVNDGDYAEWGVSGHENGISDGMERITFWLNSNMSDGNVNIVVNVGGNVSDPIGFTIRSGKIYFVSLNGNDSNNGLHDANIGSGNGPWRHIYKAMASSSVFDPGDVVYVKGGTYTDLHKYNSYLRFYNNDCGMAGLPVAYVAYPAEKVIIGDGTYDGIREHSYACEYVTISKFFINVKITAIGMASGEANKSNWRVVGNDITTVGTGWTGAVIFGASPVENENFKILGNSIHDLHGDKYYHGMYIGTVYNFPDLHNKGVEIGWNELYNFVDIGTGDNAGGPSGIYIHPTDSNAGEVDEVYIHDNIIHNLPHAGLAFASSIKNAYVWNNVLYNCGNGNLSARPSVLFGIHNDVVSNVRFYNNTIYDNNVEGADSLILFVDASGINNNVEMKNNIFYSLTSGFDSTAIGTVSSNNDIWYGATIPGYASNYINQNPLFTSPSTNDFTLQSTSPAINTGTTLALVPNDFLGVSRPQGVSYDIGAFEYVQTSESCTDNIQNQDETGIDCGGVCDACVVPATYTLTNFISAITNWLQIGNTESDVNSDGVVNTRDLGVVMSNWE
jgi:hypothetical protein